MGLTLAFVAAAAADLRGNSATRRFTRPAFGVVAAAEIGGGVASATATTIDVLGGLI